LRAMRSLILQGKCIRCNGETLPPGYIPTLFLGDLSEDQIVEAELDENLHRVNLTWQEEVAAKSKLHDLRVRQNPDHTFHDTAAELHGDYEELKNKRVPATRLSQDYALAKELETNPALAKVKTKKEAMKVLERKKGDSVLARLAERRAARPAEETETS